MAALIERFITHAALVWGFFGVCFHVPCHIATISEAFVTHCTLVWGSLGMLGSLEMRSNVSCQIFISSEHFVTISALVFILGFVE